jgi:hypothetical protein
MRCRNSNPTNILFGGSVSQRTDIWRPVAADGPEERGSGNTALRRSITARPRHDGLSPCGFGRPQYGRRAPHRLQDGFERAFQFGDVRGKGKSASHLAGAAT